MYTSMLHALFFWGTPCTIHHTIFFQVLVLSRVSNQRREPFNVDTFKHNWNNLIHPFQYNSNEEIDE